MKRRATIRSGPFARVIRIVLCLILFVAGALVVGWYLSRPAEPDAFYAAPSSLPTASGTLLRSETFTGPVPDGATAWRILYSTTRADGSPSVASAIVMATAAAGEEPRPVLAWAHGTTGIVPGCAPSMTEPFANMPAPDAGLAEGWVYVATDYIGLGTSGGHAYLVGDEAARAVIDSVRAAHALPDLALDRRTIVWGHSQGGNSALWSGMRAAAGDGAGDIDLVGIAALAPASDLPGLFEAGRGTMFGKIVSAYLLVAYADAYPDVPVADTLAPDADVLARDIAARCVGGFATLFSVLETMLLPSAGIFVHDPADGALGVRLRANVPVGPFGMPLFVAQGETDDLVLPSIQDGYVAALCQSGATIDYRRYEDRDHLSLVAPDSPLGPDLVAWTRDRFAGHATPAGCSTD